MDAREAARRWAHEWAEAWRTHDADRVARLYAPDAHFRSHPFRDPHVGAASAREYAAWAFEPEAGNEVWFGEPVVDGDRASCEYWAVVTDKDTGGVTTIAGTSTLRFQEDGLVHEQRDTWNSNPERRVPPDGWGKR